MAETTLFNDTPVANMIQKQPLQNGHSAHKNGIELPPINGTASMWGAISRWFPARNSDLDQWWQLTGPHLATMLLEAGYTIHEQCEAMIFHYYVVVPRLGPYGKPKWKSPLGLDGSPIEYSWKWNSKSGAPDVRYTLEPLGDFSGTTIDPFNQDATRELLNQLALKMPSFDLALFNHFLSYFYDIDRSKYIGAGGQPTATLCLAFELLKKGLMVKAYFVKPQRFGQEGPILDLDFWADGVKGVAPKNECADTVFNFLKTNPTASRCRPAGLAIDCVIPSKSRVKFYLQTPNTSFDSVREIMTMGGIIQGLDQQLEDLNELIKLLVGLDNNYLSSQELQVKPMYIGDDMKHFEDMPELLSGYIYYFDIAPGMSIPDIKFYIPIRYYGKDDLQIADGLTRWMNAHGRGKYTKNYMRVLNSICSHRKLEDSLGIQAYVSCAFQKGELSITSYVGLEAFHPNRKAK